MAHVDGRAPQIELELWRRALAGHDDGQRAKWIGLPHVPYRAAAVASVVIHVKRPTRRTLQLPRRWVRAARTSEEGHRVEPTSKVGRAASSRSISRWSQLP